jgi:hypothetical protein
MLFRYGRTSRFDMVANTRSCDAWVLRWFAALLTYHRAVEASEHGGYKPARRSVTSFGAPYRKVKRARLSIEETRLLYCVWQGIDCDEEWADIVSKQILTPAIRRFDREETRYGGRSIVSEIEDAITESAISELDGYLNYCAARRVFDGAPVIIAR